MQQAPYNKGVTAAKSGKTIADCPYMPNKPYGKAWINGFKSAETSKQTGKAAGEKIMTSIAADRNAANVAPSGNNVSNAKRKYVRRDMSSPPPVMHTEPTSSVNTTHLEFGVNTMPKAKSVGATDYSKLTPSARKVLDAMEHARSLVLTTTYGTARTGRKAFYLKTLLSQLERSPELTGITK